MRAEHIVIGMRPATPGGGLARIVICSQPVVNTIHTVEPHSYEKKKQLLPAS